MGKTEETNERQGMRRFEGYSTFDNIIPTDVEDYNPEGYDDELNSSGKSGTLIAVRIKPTPKVTMQDLVLALAEGLDLGSLKLHELRSDFIEVTSFELVTQYADGAYNAEDALAFLSDLYGEGYSKFLTVLDIDFL